jgi:Arm DNA-binding domain
VTPKGGRSWHYKFYFVGKCKKLTLGTYPEISLECARARHQYARNLLAQGTNPCEMKATLRKNAFVLRMREWEFAQNPPTDCLEREDNGLLHLSEYPLLTCIGMTDPTRT